MRKEVSNPTHLKISCVWTSVEGRPGQTRRDGRLGNQRLQSLRLACPAWTPHCGHVSGWIILYFHKIVSFLITFSLCPSVGRSVCLTISTPLLPQPYKIKDTSLYSPNGSAHIIKKPKIGCIQFLLALALTI